MNKWSPFLLHKEFLQIYFEKMNINTSIDIDRIVDLNDISTKSKNKFLFAIARIKSKFDLKKRISSYSYSDIINKVYLLYPNTQNEYNQHESLLFLSLLISGLCNVKIDSLFDDSKDKGSLQQAIELIKQKKICEDNKNDIEYICDNLNEIFYTNEEIRKLHNEIVNEVFEGKYDELLQKENKFNKNHKEKKANEINSTKTQNESFSLFFIFNSKLYEFIPYYRILLEVKTDTEFVTENNICNNIESFVIESESQYENDFFIFTQKNEAPKDNSNSFSFSFFNFVVLILSAILLITNFFIVNPEKEFYDLNQTYQGYFDKAKLFEFSEDVTNLKKMEIMIKKLIEKVYNDIDSDFNFHDISKIYDKKEETKYIENTNRKIYLYDVNIFCGMQIEYTQGIRTSNNDMRYDVDISYENIAPQNEKNKIFFSSRITKNVMYMLLDDIKEIFSKNITSITLKYLFYNTNYEIVSQYSEKISLLTEGKLSAETSYIGFKPFVNYHTSSSGTITINIIYMILLLYMIIAIIRTMIEKFTMLFEHQVLYFEAEDFIDIIVVTLSVINEILFCVYILFRSSLFPIIVDNENDFQYWENIIHYIEVYQKLSGITILLTCFRVVFSLCKFFPTFDMLLAPLSKGAYEFLAVLIVTLILALFFSLLSWGICGATFENFHSFYSSFINTISIANGEFDSSLLSTEKIKNGTIIAIITVIFVVLLYLIVVKIFYGVYSFRYEKEIKKKLLSHQAINKIKWDQFVVFCEKVYCLFTCQLYEKYVDEKMRKKKKKEQKDLNSTNANVVIVPEKRETLCNIFATNLKALELQNFFKKTTYTSDELNAMKKEKYITIWTNNVRNDLSEISDDLDKKYNLILNCLFFIFFIIIFVLLLQFTNYPYQQQEIKDYISQILKNQIHQNKKLTVREAKDSLKEQLEYIYRNADTESKVAPLLTKNYIFANPFFLRITFRIFNMIQSTIEHEKNYFTLSKQNKYSVLNSESCEDDSEMKNAVNYQTKISYTEANKDNALNKCGGYVYWFAYTSPNTEDSKENITVKDNLGIKNTNTNYEENLENIFKYNLGAISFDMFLTGTNDAFMIYIKSEFIRELNGKFVNYFNIDVIPINRYVNAKDFTRFCFEAIYFIVLIIIAFQEFIQYIEIFAKVIDDEFKSQDEATQLKFANSNVINKFFRFDMSKYKSRTSCVILYMFFDLILTFILRFVYLFILLIQSFLLYIMNDFFNVFDFVSLCISFSMLEKLIRIVSLTKEIDFVQHKNEARYDLVRVNEISNLYNTFIEWQSINAILIFFRVIQNFKFSQSINAIINSITRNLTSIVVSLIALLLLDFGFAMCAYAILSEYVENFSEAALSLLTLLSLLSGKQTVSNVIKEEGWVITIFIAVFFIVNTCVIINVIFGIVLFSFFDVKRREMIYKSKMNNESLLSVIFDTVANIMIRKGEIAEDIASKIVNENVYEERVKVDYEKIVEEKEKTKEIKERTRIIGEFYTHLIKEQEEMSKMYFKGYDDNSLEVKIMVYMILLSRIEDEDAKDNDDVKYINAKNVSKQFKDINSIIIDDNNNSYNNEVVVNYNNEYMKHRKYAIDEIRNCLTKKDNSTNYQENNNEIDKTIISKSNINLNDKTDIELIPISPSDNITLAELNSLFASNQGKKTFASFITQINSLHLKHLKHNLLDKYYCFLCNNNKISSHPFSSIDIYTSNDAKHRLKRYMSSNRIFNISKETQNMNQFNLSRTFIPLREDSQCFIPCESSDVIKRINDVEYEIYKLYIKYFLSPSQLVDNREDKMLFTAYHLCRYLTKDNERFVSHFVDDFMRCLRDDFINEYNKIELNDDNKNIIAELKFKYAKFHSLYSIMYMKYSRNKLKKLSEEFAKKFEISNKNSKFYSLFKVVHNLSENQSENLEAIYEKYNLDKNSHNLKQSILFVLKNEAMKNKEINFENLYKKEFLFYANENIFEFAYPKDEKANEIKYSNIGNISTNIKSKHLSQQSYEILSSFFTRKQFPSLLAKIWYQLPESEKFTFFFGYNENMRMYQNSKNTFNLYEYVNSHKTFDVYTFLTNAERSDIISMLPYPQIAMKWLLKIARTVIDKHMPNILKDDINRCKTPRDLIKLLHLKKVNFTYQSEILYQYFSLTFLNIKQIINDTERLFAKEAELLISMQKTLTIYEKISFTNFISLLQSIKKYELIILFLSERDTIAKRNSFSDFCENTNKTTKNDPLYEKPETNFIDEFDFEINENDKKSLVKQSSPIAYLLSLPAKDAYEVAGRIVNVFDKEFYMSMCEFAFECDDDISYYIKRSIKVAYSRKCDQYMKFYAIKEKVEKKKEECELIENDVNDGLNYLLNRNQQYKELYKNLLNEKKKLQIDISNVCFDE